MPLALPATRTRLLICCHVPATASLDTLRTQEQPAASEPHAQPLSEAPLPHLPPRRGPQSTRHRRRSAVGRGRRRGRRASSRAWAWASSEWRWGGGGGGGAGRPRGLGLGPPANGGGEGEEAGAPGVLEGLGLGLQRMAVGRGRRRGRRASSRAWAWASSEWRRAGASLCTLRCGGGKDGQWAGVRGAGRVGCAPGTAGKSSYPLTS